jgi:hypothetical protein
MLSGISNTTFISLLSDISIIGILGTITCHISTNFLVTTQDMGALITELFILTKLKSFHISILVVSKSNSLNLAFLFVSILALFLFNSFNFSPASFVFVSTSVIFKLFHSTACS